MAALLQHKPIRRTVRILDRNQHLKENRDKTIRPMPGATTHTHKVTLMVASEIHRLELRDDDPIFVGRYHPDNDIDVHIDLTPFGAIEQGVSRIHARLTCHDHSLYVTDMGSTNGTILAEKIIPPFRPHKLHDQDTVIFGSLAMKVIFQ